MARSRRARSAAPRRPVEWLRTRSVPAILLGAAGVPTGIAFEVTPTQLLTIVSPTIVRIRGELTLSADTALPPGVIPWAAGCVQMSKKALGAGLAAIPFPNVDDADWQWFEAGAVGDSGSSTIIPENDVVHVNIDTKSMRRYEQDDQTMVIVVSNLGLVLTNDLGVTIALSVLIKE